MNKYLLICCFSLYFFKGQGTSSKNDSNFWSRSKSRSSIYSEEKTVTTLVSIISKKLKIRTYLNKHVHTSIRTGDVYLRPLYGIKSAINIVKINSIFPVLKSFAAALKVLNSFFFTYSIRLIY